MRRSFTAAPLLAAGCVLLAACGTTVATDQRPLAGSFYEDPLAVPEAGGPDGSQETGAPGDPLGAPGDTAGGNEVPRAPGDAVGGAGSPGAGPGRQASPGGAAGVDSPRGTAAAGPGVTATSIALGIPYCNDCAGANAALGAGGDNPGDTRRYYQAALDDVNARGGVLGRKLVPVFHEIKASQNLDASAQEACETWTQDHKVLAIFMRTEVAYECARKAGVLVMGKGGSGPVFERYPNLFAPSTIRLEALGAATVRAMVRVGWHKPEPRWPTGKIGLITWEHSDYKYAINKGWLPALHEAGLEESDVRYVSVPQNADAIADATAAISSAVLSFRQKGIDHVFIADGPAGIFGGEGLTLLFLHNAKSQKYYPRYGFNSENSPGFKDYPADQQSGMLAINSYDNEKVNDEGIELNPVRERCWALMTKRSLPVGDVQTRKQAIIACEIAWFAEAVLKRARGTTLPDVIAAAHSLGTSFRSPWAYGTRIGPQQRDGVYLFRSARFDDGCECMQYTGRPHEP
jgi:hypothetical protein